LIETLYDRATAQVLKMKRNGKDMEIPENDIEVISQDEATVTVPAGTFVTVHIVAKSKQAKKIEVWANPMETTMDGTVKQMVNTGFMDITMELTEFNKVR